MEGMITEMSEEESKKTERGGISVQTEHIFPIIKKWLYSEKEIFLREIVSNACDAVTKLKRLQSLGQAEQTDEKYRITVRADKDEKTLTVSDNGIGMTEEELKKYICQIALSGALDFIAKYEGESEDGAKNGIIGHFGLGFYSSFMVSDSVEITTRSYNGEPAVHWSCGDSGEYEINTDAEKDGRGTDVVMHIAEGEEEYLDNYKLREILNRYCAFMPVEIYLDDSAEKETEKDGDKEGSKEKEEPKPINDTMPLWQKNPSECTDEEYDEFYRKVFSDFRQPMFHIHINADYPLNFKGILYFPKIETEYGNLEGQVKLYYNQVFVADNIKEVIPEYLLMLKGVLDCPELPLNVSRSYLQNSSYVSKLSAHIVKKVADKLNSMFNLDRENYQKLWDDIKIFAEYACLRDRKFYDRVKGSVLLPLSDGSYATVDEYLEAAKEKHENIIYYAADKTEQAQYIELFGAQDIKVALMPNVIDTQFMTLVEQDRSVKFVRVDAELADALKGDGETFESEALTSLLKKVSGNDKLTVKYEPLKADSLPAVIMISEQSRRVSEMMKLYSMGKDVPGIPEEATIVLNTNSSLVKKIRELAERGDASAEIMTKQMYTLALMSQRRLSADEMKQFLSDSFGLLEKQI